MKTKRIMMMAASAMMLIPMGLHAQTEGKTDVTYLVLTENNGSVSKFALDSSPELSFNDQQLVVTCQGDELSLSLSDVDSYSFVTEQVVTAIDPVVQHEGTIGASTPTFSFRDARVNGLEAGAVIALYTVNGTLIEKKKADSQGAVSINLGNLPQGIYILRTPNKSFKFTNK